MKIERLDDNHPSLAACRSGDVETVAKFLNRGINIRADSARNPTLISCATGEGQLEVVKLLVSKGIDVREPLPGIGGRAPIFLALGYNRLELVDYFFRAGTPYDIRDEYGTQPIMCAAGAGNLVLIKRILDEGVDVNGSDCSGLTAIIYAARANHLPSLELLSASGAAPEKTDGEKKTALIHASQRGKTESVQGLLDHGADIAAADQQGKTALDWARANGHENIAKLLQSWKKL